MEVKPTKLSLEEITELGRHFYFDTLQERLEITNLGQYVVIEPASKEYFINEDLTKALQQARDKYPEDLFYIVKIGDIRKPRINNISHAWSLI